MQIMQAKVSGMCFGVRDALRMAQGVAQPWQVSILGELVHNPLVNAALARQGFDVRGEQVTPLMIRGVPATLRDTVLITAHGVSDRRRAALRASGKELIDTTCPLVRRAHRAAVKLAEAGYHVVVIGQRGHVEVAGLTGDLPSFTVVENVREARPLGALRLGVIAQTTSFERDVEAILAALRAANPQAEMRFVDTVCQPTRQRQRALEELLGQVEVMVVVGGRHSNNTRKLVEHCLSRGVRALHVEGPGELQPALLAGAEHIGVTAGTSTLPETLAAVRAELEALASAVARPAA